MLCHYKSPPWLPALYTLDIASQFCWKPTRCRELRQEEWRGGSREIIPSDRIYRNHRQKQSHIKWNAENIWELETLTSGLSNQFHLLRRVACFTAARTVRFLHPQILYAKRGLLYPELCPSHITFATQSCHKSGLWSWTDRCRLPRSPLAAASLQDCYSLVQHPRKHKFLGEYCFKGTSLAFSCSTNVRQRQLIWTWGNLKHDQHVALRIRKRVGWEGIIKKRVKNYSDKVAILLGNGIRICFQIQDRRSHR